MGNVRISYQDGNDNGSVDATEIVEENNYYPFGLKHKGYNANVSSLGNSTAQKWKYNGMEQDESLGLETYDFGARNYDPALGRWMNIDPLAELMRRHSPYNYAYSNPVVFIDPDGMLGQAALGLLGGSSSSSSSSMGSMFTESEEVKNDEEKGEDKIIVRDENGDVCDGDNCDVTSSIQAFLNVLNESLEGFYEVEALDNGQLIINRTGKKGEISNRVEAISSALGNLINNSNTVEITVTQNSSTVLGGSFDLETIDMTDVQKFGDGPLLSSEGVIIHELVEQFEKQVNGIKSYKKAHNIAITAEGKIDNSKRVEALQKISGSNLILPFIKDGKTQYMKIIINPANQGQILKVEQ